MRSKSRDDRLLFELSEGVAIMTLNRPDVMNAFEDGMREALFERLEECANDQAVRCIVITGAGRAFSAGGDIASMAKLQEENDLSIVEARMNIAGQVIQQIRRMPQPVLAAINGAAAGAGMNLALACDMRIASDKAVLVESFVKVGSSIPIGIDQFSYFSSLNDKGLTRLRVYPETERFVKTVREQAPLIFLYAVFPDFSLARAHHERTIRGELESADAKGHSLRSLDFLD